MIWNEFHTDTVSWPSFCNGVHYQIIGRTAISYDTETPVLPSMPVMRQHFMGVGVGYLSDTLTLLRTWIILFFT